MDVWRKLVDYRVGGVVVQKICLVPAAVVSTDQRIVSRLSVGILHCLLDEHLDTVIKHEIFGFIYVEQVTQVFLSVTSPEVTGSNPFAS